MLSAIRCRIYMKPQAAISLFIAEFFYFFFSLYEFFYVARAQYMCECNKESNFVCNINSIVVLYYCMTYLVYITLHVTNYLDTTNKT